MHRSNLNGVMYLSGGGLEEAHLIENNVLGKRFSRDS